jgi:hypothetical protein
VNAPSGQLGLCGIVGRTLTDEVEYIVYDNSLELSRPYYDRDKRWKQAIINSLPNGRIIADFPLQVKNIFGPFYAIVINTQDVDRSSVD